jgi:hypothetical protein
MYRARISGGSTQEDTRMMKRSLILAVAVATSAAGGLQGQLSQPLDDEALSAFTWRSIGPVNMGGRVTDVEGVPSPSKTFYVAAASGGIWKTTNNGITFRPAWTEQRVVAMGDIAIAPSDPSQIWAGTGEEDSRNSISVGGGIFKSADGGMTWEYKGLKETQVIGHVLVHPSNPAIVYVAALGHAWDSNPERGLYRTTNGGTTWELVKFISDKAGFVEIAMHPRNPDVLFAASWERVRGPWFLQSGGPGSALWKSTDGGDSWIEVVGGGFPTAMKGRIGLAISHSNPDVMYAMVEAEKEADGTGGNGLYRSEDGGATWEKRNDINTRPFYYSMVRVDPSNPDRVYFSSVPLQFSDDGGKTYGSTAVGVHTDDHAMWIDPNDPERIILGNDGGVAITYDRGGNWQYLNNMALGQFYHVSYNMDVPYRVCGGLQDNYTWCGPSRVADGQIGKYHWATISGGDGFFTAQDPENPNIVWSESQGGNMGRSNLATGERTSLVRPDWEAVWRPYQDTIVTLMKEGVPEGDPRIQSLRTRASRDSAAYDMRWNWSTPFFQSVHDRRHFYAAGNMVVKSTNWGDTLTPISPDLSYNDAEKVAISLTTTGGITTDATGAETYGTVVSLAESPLRQGMLFAGTDDGRVWITRNDGGDWSDLTDRFRGVPKNTYVSRIEPSHVDIDRFYVTFDSHRTNDFTPYVYVTDDGGRRFRSIASNLPTGSLDYVHVIREDPHNENLLFVGTDLGAYVSTNRGRSWRRFMEGLPAVPVHDLEIHPRDRELIAATHGRSLWIVDIAPLEGLSDRVVADGAALFDPKPAFQFGMPPRGGEFYAQFWFQRPTPGAVAEVSYYIGEQAAAELQAAFDSVRAQAAAQGPGAGGEAAAGLQMPAREAGAAQGESGAAARAMPARQGAGAGAGAPARRAPTQAGAGGGPGFGGQGGQRGPQVEITVTNADGAVVNTVRGPAGAGIHTVRWNMRGQAAAPEAPSPYAVYQREKMAERAKFVADSLIEAGWDSMMVRRSTGIFTGQTDPQAVISAFTGGGGGGGRDPEAFVERPAEQTGAGPGGFGSFSQMRELGEIIAPGQSTRAFFRMFRGRGGAGGGPVVEPGTYTLTLKIGDRTFTRELTVERVGEFTGNNSPF